MPSYKPKCVCVCVCVCGERERHQVVKVGCLHVHLLHWPVPTAVPLNRKVLRRRTRVLRPLQTPAPLTDHSSKEAF